MLGLDQWLATLSDGTTLAAVVVVAIALGLRHATDPDHLAAVTALVANGRGGATRLGLAWGAGHATALLALGVPIVLWKAYLPARVEQSAEVTVGLVIVALALWLLARARRGGLEHAHPHVRPARSPRQACLIGLLHGIGGSGGVAVLLLAAVHSHAVAIVALTLFAAGTAVSMALLSTGWGLLLQRPRVQRRFRQVVPVLGAASLVFGLWYTLGALAVAPYAL